MVDQTASGRAWEYALAQEFANTIPSASLSQGGGHKNAQISYHATSSTTKRELDRAARRAVAFLMQNDSRIALTTDIEIPSNRRGQQGDVRDHILHSLEGTIGISAKKHHDAVKHSRLSDQIDFGEIWYGEPCSRTYWRHVNPVFLELRNYAADTKWRDIPDKHKRYYLPILEAFILELKSHADPPRLLRYLLGRDDFYKVIVEKDQTVTIQSFNMDGTLEWGRKLRMPDTVHEAHIKPNSTTTAIVILSDGWQISFRIHSARSDVEPSLKFDITLVGHPKSLSQHSIPAS